MWLRIAVAVAAIVVVPFVARAQTSNCVELPLLEDSMPAEQRADLLQKRAMACVREGKLPQSIALFSELIGLQPSNTTAYLSRGSAYLQTGQFELGIADFSHLITVEPKMPEAWYNRGTAFIAARQYERAIADLGEAIRLKPSLARAYCNRALALTQKSEYDKALSDLNTGIEKDSKLPFCHYARGELYFAKGNYKSAIDDLTIGLRLQPNVQGLTTRGKAYELLGDREKALADYRAALAIAPGFKEAQEGEARLKQTLE